MVVKKILIGEKFNHKGFFRTVRLISLIVSVEVKFQKGPTIPAQNPQVILAKKVSDLNYYTALLSIF